MNDATERGRRAGVVNPEAVDKWGVVDNSALTGAASPDSVGVVWNARGFPSTRSLDHDTEHTGTGVGPDDGTDLRHHAALRAADGLLQPVGQFDGTLR